MFQPPASAHDADPSNPDAAGAVQALTACGVAPTVAGRLVAHHGASRCRMVAGWIRAAPPDRRPRNPAGWARRALEEGWPPPPWVSAPGPPRAPLVDAHCPACGLEFAYRADRPPACPQCAHVPEEVLP